MSNVAVTIRIMCRDLPSTKNYANAETRLFPIIEI